MNPEQPIEKKKVRKNARIRILPEEPAPALSLNFVNANTLGPTENIQREVVEDLQSVISPTNITLKIGFCYIMSYDMMLYHNMLNDILSNCQYVKATLCRSHIML